MKFVTESYSLSSNDGRIILRACIDRPANSDHAAFKFLNSYSVALCEFVEHKLFLKAREAYDEAKRMKDRFVPLLYKYKCSVTYSDDTYLSCVMIAELSQSSNTIARAIDSIVFYGNQILPPNQIIHNPKKKKIALDSEGFPATVELISSKIELRRVGKNSI